ncbi:MAG: cytochrome c oxidase subunit I [Chloroflexota bacterium]
MVAAAATVGRRRSFWAGNNAITAVASAIAAFVVFEYGLGANSGPFSGLGFEQNQILLLSYFAAIVAYFAGLGYLTHPIRWLFGADASEEQLLYDYGAGGGTSRYWRLTLDHKVIGIQYLIFMITIFCIGGFNAMLIRAELMTPTANLFSPETYLTLVGEHSVMMLMMASSLIIGPFGNYFIPLFIGAKRMAYPRIEALSFWLFPIGIMVLASAYIFGGFPTGWTGYAPLADQAHTGMDGYLVAFALIGTSMIVSAINILATVLMMRAPGATWTRMAMTVWSTVVASILAWLAAPILIGVLVMVMIDRALLTGFFLPIQGGSAFLYENLFWTFGHPEVYILAVPAFGVILDIIPVFARKTLYAYKASVTSMFGIGLLSWFVWQHHLFVSGLTPGLRPFFMFTTEMISFPTGIIFLSGLLTLFGGRLRFPSAMLFALAFFPNFLLGGFSGIFLSDVPADVQLHGSYFVQAHFHFVLMGGTLFGLFAGTYYWFPKFTGRMMNETLGKVHFWSMYLGFNGTFITLAVVGLQGMPRRIPDYLPYLHTTNLIASLFAFLLGASMLPFLANMIYSWKWGTVAVQNPWASHSLEWMLPTPVPLENFEEIPLVVGSPHVYGAADPRPMAILKPSEQAAGGVATAGN